MSHGRHETDQCRTKRIREDGWEKQIRRGNCGIGSGAARDQDACVMGKQKSRMAASRDAQLCIDEGECLRGRFIDFCGRKVAGVVGAASHEHATVNEGRG